LSDFASIYIHVPFCVKKCRYCDFYSQQNLLLIPDYIQALIKEIYFRADPAKKIETIYFGGGTPSVLSVKEIGQILKALDRAFTVSPEAEITVEVNPGTVDAHFLSQLNTLGVNRLSIGAQSFDERKLHFLGRIHSADQAWNTLIEADRAGFDNIGVDLIYGLSFETNTLWQKDLEKVISFRPSHLSCYMLTIEEGTPLHTDVEKGRVHPLSSSQHTLFFKMTSRVLTDHGYDHYEISNFAKTHHYRSRHNSNYWKMTPYLGFGPAAHSYDGKTRSWNPSDTDQYINDIQAGGLPVREKEKLTAKQMMLEMILLRLRTKEGVSLDTFYRCFGIKFETKFKVIIGQIEKEYFGSIKDNFFFLNLEGKTHLNSIVETFAEQII